MKEGIRKSRNHNAPNITKLMRIPFRYRPKKISPMAKDTKPKTEDVSCRVGNTDRLRGRTILPIVWIMTGRLTYIALSISAIDIETLVEL